MASTQIYSKEAVNNLDVLTPYRELMIASMDKDSIYIHAKETMEAFFANSTMTDVDKANILSGMLTQMVAGVTDNAMNSATQIAKENRDGVYQLTAIREDTLLKQEQRDKIAQDTANAVIQGTLIQAQKDEMVIKGWSEQASMEKDLGVLLGNLPATTATVKLPATAVADQGTKWEQMQQLKMSVYATLAKSYRENGTITWTVDPATNKINTISDLAPTTPGLTKRQEQVAIRQEKAFDDNKVQHAANSSANMIGLLLSASNSGALTASDVTKWRTSIDYLNTSGVATVPINTVYGSIVILTSPATISKAGTGYVVSGTAANVPAGNSVTVTVETTGGISTEAATVLASDNTWSVTLVNSMVSGIGVDSAAIVKAMVVDSTSHARYDTNPVNVTA